MKLGLLHQVDTTKIHLKGHVSFVSFEHKSLQELAAALYICHVLEHGDDIQVSVNEHLLYLSVVRKNIYYRSGTVNSKSFVGKVLIRIK